MRDELKTKSQLIQEMAELRRRLSHYESLESDYRIQHALLFSLFESDLIGILMADPVRISYANDAFLTIIGYTREDMYSGNIKWRSITPPEHLPLDEKGIQEMIEHGGCTPYEKDFIRKDGSRVPILLGATLLEREPLKWVCFVLDNSERKRAEERIKRHQEELEQLVKKRTDQLETFYRQTSDILESIGDAFYALNKDWEVTYINREAERLFKCKREEIMGRNLFDWLPKLKETSLYQHFCQAMFERAPVTFKIKGVYSDFWGEYRVYPAKEGITVYIRDLTEQENTERALRESNRSLYRLFNNSPAMMALIRADDAKYVDVNESWLRYMGYKREEVIGRTLADIRLCAQSEEEARFLSQLAEGGEITNRILEYRTKAGEIRVGLASAVMFMIEGINHQLAIMQDITDSLAKFKKS